MDAQGSDARGNERGMLLNGILAAMRLSAEPMLLTDPHQHDNPIVAANAAFSELTQYSEAELIGRNCRLLQGPKTDRDAARQIGDCLARGAGCVQFLVNHRRDGSAFYNLLFVAPVLDHAGTLQFFFSSQHDLSGAGAPNMDAFRLGPAQLSAGQQSELRLILLDIAHEVSLAAAAETLPARVRAMDSAVQAAREVGRLSLGLTQGMPALPGQR